MSCVGLEPTIPASKRVKTIHALDRSATVTGQSSIISRYNLLSCSYALHKLPTCYLLPSLPSLATYCFIMLVFACRVGYIHIIELQRFYDKDYY
jgi:hypothetical protein